MSQSIANPPPVVARVEDARREAVRARRPMNVTFAVLFAVALAVSLWIGEVRPDVLLEDLPNFFNYIHDTLPPIAADTAAADIAEWYWGLDKWLLLLWDTILIAFLGTLMGGCGAVLFCFLASRNLAPGRAVYFVTRRLLEFARSVPELVFAMVFVFAFGLGPLAGVLAIAVHTFGALGKLFAEVNENVDTGPIHGVRAAGADWFQEMRYAVVPQVLPNMLSYGLLRFEINVRAATVIGFVGAGGIGQELLFVIRQFIYVDISAIVILIILTVSLIDLACETLRHRFIAEGGAL